MKNYVVLGAIGLLLAGAAIAAAQSDEATLLGSLKSGDETARQQAIDAIAERAQVSPELVAALSEQLDHASAKVRTRAAFAMGRLGAAANPAAEKLVKMVLDPDVAVRRAATRAWPHIPGVRPLAAHVLNKALKEADPTARNQALLTLAEIGKPAVPMLIAALEDDDSDYWACIVLGQMGAEAAEAVPALVKSAKSDEQIETRREAILALGGIGPAAEKAVPALIELLDDKEKAIQASTVFTLAQIGPAAAAAADALEKGTASNDPFQQTICAWAVAKIKPNDQAARERAIALLIAAVKHKDTKVRGAALRGLIELRPGPARVLDALESVMKQGAPKDIDDCLNVYAELGAPAVPHLVGALKSAPQHRGLVAMILGHLGPVAKDAAPALIEMVGDKNPHARREALMALGGIGPDAEAAVPAATQAIADADEKVAYAAYYTLGRIGPAAKAAVPALEKRMDDQKDPFAAFGAAWAISMIQPDAPGVAAKAVPLLVQGLQDAEAKFRYGAVMGLKRFGPAAKDAIPALQKAQKEDKDPLVRETAQEALKAIGG